MSDIVLLGSGWVFGNNDVTFRGDRARYGTWEVVAAARDGVRTVFPCDVGGGVGLAVARIAVGFV